MRRRRTRKRMSRMRRSSSRTGRRSRRRRMRSSRTSRRRTMTRRRARRRSMRRRRKTGRRRRREPIPGNNGVTSVVVDTVIRLRHTHQIDQLGQAEAQFDEHGVRIIGYGPYKAVVVGQQIVVQPFGIGVARCQTRDENNKGHQAEENPTGSQHHTGTVHTSAGRAGGSAARVRAWDADAADAGGAEGAIRMLRRLRPESPGRVPKGPHGACAMPPRPSARIFEQPGRVSPTYGRDLGPF
ncbi:unnamed protein product, partial [Nesidiocoris tenuis]